MKILSAQQIRDADQYTIEKEPIKSIDLMERASRAFVNWFEAKLSKSGRVFVFCGTGNNGGDGLAIARMLIVKKWNVIPITIKKSSKRSQDFMLNYLKLAEVRNIPNIELESDLNFEVSENDYIIDAVFGSGLNKPVKGIQSKVIEFINSQSATTISVDTPSGLYIDSNALKEDIGPIINADYTISFQLPKLSFFFEKHQQFVGDFSVVNIGLHQDFIDDVETKFEYIEFSLIKSILKTRLKFSHKGTYGRSLIISGSWGKIGASVLCSKACLRSGAGLVTVHIPSCGYQILQASVPEAMVSTDIHDRFLTTLPDIKNFDAIGVGPGIDIHMDTYEVISQLLSRFQKPIVFDADAINIISNERSFLKMLPEGSILTPHPGEFRRLVGDWKDELSKLDLQLAMSQEYKVYIVLKGAHTSISTPNGKLYFNSTGNPGMATAGSGDVLTGVITSLLGQGYSPKEASILGVYVHGLAGDISARNLGEDGLIAGDIINNLPKAFQSIRKL